MVLPLYVVNLILLLVYSYSLVDPNITLINHPLWEQFRNQMVILGYYKRDVSWIIYLTLSLGLVSFNLYFIKRYKRFHALKIALLTSLILLLSYPFLSKDFFNYMFDARILTFYHKNPYLFKALDFQKDNWLRFMHWTHRTYPYGPTFLPLTLIPSFLSFGKFILNFIFFKTFFAVFYLLSVYYLQKLNKKWAIFFATSPIVIIEGLVNSHNDLVSVAFAIAGIYYLNSKRKIISGILLALSGGVKYITLPLLILIKNKYVYILNKTVATIGLSIIVGYLSMFKEIQPWYFLNLLVLLPLYYKYLSKIHIFFYGLLLSYYPFIRLGGWGNPSNVALKHNIIASFFVLNVLYLFYQKAQKKDNARRFEPSKPRGLDLL